MSRPFGVAPTVAEIARRLDRPLHRVQYVIRSRNLKPAYRAGNARVFADADVELIARELDRIESRRSEGGAG